MGSEMLIMRSLFGKRWVQLHSLYCTLEYRKKHRILRQEEKSEKTLSVGNR